MVVLEVVRLNFTSKKQENSACPCGFSANKKRSVVDMCGGGGGGVSFV